MNHKISTSGIRIVISYEFKPGNIASVAIHSIKIEYNENRANE